MIFRAYSTQAETPVTSNSSVRAIVQPQSLKKPSRNLGCMLLLFPNGAVCQTKLFTVISLLLISNYLINSAGVTPTSLSELLCKPSRSLLIDVAAITTPERQDGSYYK